MQRSLNTSKYSRREIEGDSKLCTRYLEQQCHHLTIRETNLRCSDGDFCMKSIDRSRFRFNKLACPITTFPNVGDRQIDCVFRNRAQTELVEKWYYIQNLTKEEYLQAISGPGIWDCERNTWILEGNRPVYESNQPATSPVGIIAYGCSVTRNIFDGMILATLFKDSKISNVTINTQNHPSNMLYVSCGTCAPCDENTMSWCNENKYNAVHRVEEWIKETNFVNYFLIYRPSLHIQNNVSATIDEMSHLLARLNHLIVSTKQNIEIIWIHLHGSGRLKSSKHMLL